MRSDFWRTWGITFYLGLCLLLGGASGRGAGALANGLLQVVAVLIIVAALWHRPSPYPRPALQLIAIIGAFILWVLLSLIPLPPALWSSLPGRDVIAHGYLLLGVPLPASAVTLSWQLSIASMLWLLPPTALFLLAVHASPPQRVQLMWVLLILMAVSIILGVAQLLGGTGSSLRFYQITNKTQPVGFFANTNHFATLLVCGLPLAGYLAGSAASGRVSQAQRGSRLMLAGAIAIFLLAGIGTIGSLAGFGLTLPAAMAGFLIYRRAATGKVGRAWGAGLAAIFLLFLGFALAGPLNSQSLSDKIAGSPTSRGHLASTTVTAIGDFLPVGSGLGTFPEVYRTFDDPNRVVAEHTNHAHNDYLEVLLELGLAGALLVLAFITWWLLQSINAWKSNYQGSGLARAGSVIILVVLLHSIVDYPLRTSAIAALFALACAFLIPYSRGAREEESSPTDESLRHLKA